MLTAAAVVFLAIFTGMAILAIAIFVLKFKKRK